MNVTLPKWEGKPYDGTIPPLVWTKDTDGAVLITCENGHLASIRDHQVDTDGRVTPSILCYGHGLTAADCGWHVFAQLEGWPG